MKMTNRILVLILGIGMVACTSQPRTSEEAPLIAKKQLKLESDLMTPEVLWSFGRIGEVELSPDKTQVIFTVAYYDIPQNKGNRDIYLLNLTDRSRKQISSTPVSEFNIKWRPDGKKVGFLSSQSGSVQLWEMDPDGANSHQVSDIDGGITGFSYSPDQKWILFTKEVKLDQTVQELYPDLPKTSGKIITDLMYRHWDQWVETYSHVFVAGYNGQTVGTPKDIMEGEKWECPLRPFGGMEEICWSPDSKYIAYTSKKLMGRDYALSTNSDIYLYSLETGETRNLSNVNMGFDRAPVFSPDGKLIAWESMERDGYEADRIRLFVMDLATGNITNYSKTFDQDATGLAWSEDGQSIFFISDWHATDEIYRLDLASGTIAKITNGIHDYLTVAPAGDKLLATKQSMSKPTEIYLVNPADGSDEEISFENKDFLDQLAFGKVESRWIPTTDGKEMLVWVIYPSHFDPAKKYPALLFCEGGPQNTVNQFWSYRWNFQIMAANGYLIVAPNRRGLPGFGLAWNEQISGDYGGQNMQDLLSAIDAVAKEPYVDNERLGAVGASYGGYSVYWLAGNHHKRFKTFIAHDGMFNFESQYLQTEEMWFPNWDFGGPFWEKENPVVRKSYAASPHNFVQNWDTPILVIHSQQDFRVPVGEGMSAFNAARLRNIPAKFLYFPDENHWVLSPQNGILWQRTFFSWLDQWLK
jgi:dipeptidyl aminopeptidase/acylaminoacyl peptidase